MTIHFLPKYAPQTNPLERVWWHLYEEITRNHRFRSIDELFGLVFEWFGYQDTFAIETSVYPQTLSGSATIRPNHQSRLSYGCLPRVRLGDLRA